MMCSGRPQFRMVPVSSHYFTLLKEAWGEIYTLAYELMKIGICMNVQVTSLFFFLRGR
jgi:hypothetical protein